MATWQLDAFLRNYKAAATPTTVPGIGPGGWDKNALANSQGQSGRKVSIGTPKTVYRVYTQDIRRNATLDIVRRYFEGATAFYGVGLDARTQLSDENSVTFEIVTSKPDSLQRILDLAGDIRIQNEQISVLITRQSVDTFEVTETTPTKGTL
jgi:hypothetical protein